MNAEVVDPTDLGTPAQQMEQAKQFFAEQFGLEFNSENGFATEPTVEQLDALASWHQGTTQSNESGSEMPTEDLFYKKVLLAQALMPQVDSKGNIQYLFGKGIGAEITTQGEVLGRSKVGGKVPYRTHSDFEIYAVNPEHPDELEGGERFRHVFGNEEYFPPSRTKGLRDIPDTLLKDTAERVDLGGVILYVPKLEMQYVDKSLKNNERVEVAQKGMTDAQSIAQCYELDADDVDHILTEMYEKPILSAFDGMSEAKRLRSQMKIIGVGKFKVALPSPGPNMLLSSADVNDLVTWSDEELATYFDDLAYKLLSDEVKPILQGVQSLQTREAEQVA